MYLDDPYFHHPLLDARLRQLLTWLAGDQQSPDA
jgi:hypothetical protein